MLGVVKAAAALYKPYFVLSVTVHAVLPLAAFGARSEQTENGVSVFVVKFGYYVQCGLLLMRKIVCKFRKIVVD